MKSRLYITLLFLPLLASAQLAVTVSPVKAIGSKAVVPLAMRNGFAVNIESARAACFLLDERGKVVGRATQWVIGSGRDKSPLSPGATKAFFFVVPSDKLLVATNLTAGITFNRVVLKGGKLADPHKDVQVRHALK